VATVKRPATASAAAGAVWSADEARRFLTAVTGERLEPLWRLELNTGLRRAEAAGLRWSDVDFARQHHPGPGPAHDRGFLRGGLYGRRKLPNHTDLRGAGPAGHADPRTEWTDAVANGPAAGRPRRREGRPAETAMCCRHRSSGGKPGRSRRRRRSGTAVRRLHSWRTAPGAVLRTWLSHLGLVAGRTAPGEEWGRPADRVRAAVPGQHAAVRTGSATHRCVPANVDGRRDGTSPPYRPTPAGEVRRGAAPASRRRRRRDAPGEHWSPGGDRQAEPKQRRRRRQPPVIALPAANEPAAPSREPPTPQPAHRRGRRRCCGASTRRSPGWPGRRRVRPK
jgi:hypothetical protein